MILVQIVHMYAIPILANTLTYISLCIVSESSQSIGQITVFWQGCPLLLHRG